MRGPGTVPELTRFAGAPASLRCAHDRQSSPVCAVSEPRQGPVADGAASVAGGGQLDTVSSDLAVTAGWGIYQPKAGAVMPGAGKLQQRAYDEDEANAIDAEATAQGMSANDVLRLLGPKTCDVYLNGAAYWCNIPQNVWEYHIGGYQVIKKWLSYREEPILGRPLKSEEAREVMNTARRIAAIMLLQPKLDDNYQNVRNASFAWGNQR